VFMQRKSITFIYIIIVLFLFSCKSMPSMARAPMAEITLNEAKDTITIERETVKTDTIQDYPLEDIMPATLKIPVLKLHPTKSEEEEKYFIELNKAINLMDKEKYAEASEILKTMSQEYKDHGRCLYNLGLCYYNLKDRDNALTHLATSYVMGTKLSNKLIGHICFDIGYEHLQNKNWIEAIRYLKIAQPLEAASQNILYCYYQLALSLPLTQQTIMLLYAGRYMIENRLTTENVVSVGLTLGKQLRDEPASPYLTDAIKILHYVTIVKNDPYVHQYLGFLYLYANETAKAEAEFKAAAARSGSDKELARFIGDKLIELKPVQYTYTREWPFTVKLKSGSLKSCSIKVLYTLPLTTIDQTVSDIQVSLNNQRLEYEVVNDSNGTPFLQVTLNKNLKEGDNKVVIKAKILRIPKWVGKEALSVVKKSDYDKSSPLYKAYTASTGTSNTAHPLVQAARKELSKYLKQENVIVVARAVYDYVINKMKYELYDSSERPRTEILSRLLANNYSGVCEDYAVMTVAILRSFGIPCLYLTGPNYKADIGHAWPAIWLPGFEDFIVIDTTWGDGEMPNFYFLFNTNLTVIDSPLLESNLMAEGQNSRYQVSANVEIELGKEVFILTR
jgi:tetratricopeptide (TPR) repeat protein